MFCTRCGREVADILWEDNDHPVLLEHPMVVNRTDLKGSDNEVKVTAHFYVEKRKCSEVLTVVRTDFLKE